MNWFAQNAGWLWAGGGIVGAALAFFFLSRIFGWKVGAIVAGAILAVGQFLAMLARAERRGYEAAEERQRQEHDDEVRRIEEAKRLERERQAREGLDPDNPFHVDRHSGRVPDDRRP